MFFKSKSTSPWSQSFNPIIFCLISVIQGIVVLCLEIPILTNVRRYKKSGLEEDVLQTKLNSLFVYILIFIASQVFQIALSIESVVLKNTIQIFGVIAFNIMAFFYSVTQYFQMINLFGNVDEFDPEQGRRYAIYIGVVAIVIGIGQVCLTIFGFKLYKEFGWKIYRRLGSDLTLRKYFMTYHVLTMFIKFDFFFFIGFITQFLNFTVRSGDVERSLTIAFLPVGLFLLLLAIFSVHRENKWLAGLSIMGFACGVIYFIFKIFRIFTVPKYDNYKYFLLMFAFLALVTISVTLGLLIICVRNFDKGLTPHIQFSLRKRQTDKRASLNLAGE